jgi:integrase
MEETGKVKIFDAAGDMTQRWFAFVVLPDAFGKPKRYKAYAPARAGQTEQQRRAALLQIAQELESKVANGFNPFLEKKQQNIIALMREVAHVKTRIIAKKWHNSYLVVIDLFEVFMRKRGIVEPVRADIYDFRTNLIEHGGVRNRKLSNKTINNYTSIINTLYEELVQAGKVKENICKSIKPLPTEVKGHTPYKNEHITQFLAFAKENEPMLYVFVNFLYYTLNRPNAIRHLRIGDIELQNRRIRFTSQHAKNKKVGYVVISDHFADFLKGLSLSNYPAHFYVFGREGEPGMDKMGVTYFYKANVRVLKMLKLMRYGYTLYSWKHTGAIHLYNAIRDIKRVSEQCLHADVSVTMRYLRGLGVIFGNDEIMRKQPKLGG